MSRHVASQDWKNMPKEQQEAMIQALVDARAEKESKPVATAKGTAQHYEKAIQNIEAEVRIS